jgi:hypothetical protein
MSFQQCLDTIKQAAGRNLSDDELDDLISELQRRQRQKMLARETDNLDEAVLSAADDYAREMAEAALIQKRNAAINLKRRLEAVDFVRSQFKDDPALGIQSLLVGSARSRQGVRRSAAAEQEGLHGMYLAGFVADVEAKGPSHWSLLTSGELDRDIARALWARNRQEPMPVDAPQEAIDIADAIAKWQETARLDLNKAGGWVKKMPGYIVRQSHDMWKIHSAGYEAWRDAILPRLDMERTFDGADPDKFLRGVYTGLASGSHLRTHADAPSGFTGPANIAKKASAERVLHFRSGDDWFDYNQQFGTGSIREAVLRGLEMNAKTTGLMRKMGTNPEANLKRIIDELNEDIVDPKARRSFSEASHPRGRLYNYMAELDGSTRSPVNRIGAQISSIVRSAINMAKLGGALLSQIPDLTFFAAEMRRQTGRGYGSGIPEAAGLIMRGRNRKEFAEINAAIGVFDRGMIGDITSRFSFAEDGLPGTMTKLQQLFFKFNGMTWWTDILRAGAARATSHNLAFHRASTFKELRPELQRMLGHYGIDAGRWDLIRAGATKEADGMPYATPEGLDAVPDDSFARYLESQGTKPTPGRIADLRRDIGDQMRTYFIDRASYAVTEPDALTRAMMQQGTQVGTVYGELLRHIGQFKSFAVAVIQKQFGAEIYGRGSDTLRQALRNGNGEMLGLAQLMLWTTILGYGAMSAKDLVKGRSPRELFDEDDVTGLNRKTIAAAMVQGGGLGIYGDFLFGELKNRHGGGIITTLAGPAASSAQDIFDLVGRIRAGDDAAAAAFRTALNNTPFANLFYTRVAMDYLFLWSIQEALNPGAMKRMEKRIEQENAQTFWLRPSEAVR